MNKKRPLLRLLLLLIAVAGYTGRELYQYYQDSKRVSQQNVRIKDMIRPLQTDENQSPHAQRLLAFEELVNLNADFVGWLRIEDTQIDYPVLRGQDNVFYLDKDLYKEYSKYGSIFMDFNVSLDPRSDNLIIYGHHMKDGQMFGELVKYLDQDFYEEHKQIGFYSLEDFSRYEIIAVFKTSVYNSNPNEFAYYEYIDFSDEAQFQTYLQKIRQLSLYTIPFTAAYGESLITLSTCEYSLENGRVVVVAKKIEASDD